MIKELFREKALHGLLQSLLIEPRLARPPLQAPATQPSNGLGVDQMLTSLHPRVQTVFGVLCADRKFCLHHGRATVEIRCDKVHGAAMLGIARFERSSMGVQALVTWQQGGMNVEHTS